jgi:hypothetical protein
MLVTTFQLMVSQTMSQPKCDFLKIAHDFIAREFPFFDPTGKTLVVSDNGDLWEMTYDLPEGMFGGTPTVIIDKRTCKIVRAFHEQ